MNLPEETASLRRSFYCLLIVVAVAGVGGRIQSAARVYEPGLFRPEGATNDPRGPWPTTRPEPVPTFGSNDRARWDTVRALVDEGTYAIGYRPRELVFGSVSSLIGVPDAMHAAALVGVGHEYRTKNDHGIITEDGWQGIDKVLHPRELKFYSSKPPLLPTLIAGEYWLLKKLFGWSIVRNRWAVVRVILLTVNGLPFLFYLLVLARLVERFGTTSWGKMYVMAAACFGTFLTTFSITLNNHTLATCTALFALAPVLRVWYGGERGGWLFAVAGFFAAFTACNELPAASLAAVLFVALLAKSPWKTLACFVPAALVPVAAFFLTNYLALGQWRPAYGEFGGPWYEFEGSYWGDPSRHYGIDYARLKESKAVYALHLLIGHHGAFSLTPIFLLALAGMGWALRTLLSRSRGDLAADTTAAGRESMPPAVNGSGLQMLGVMSLMVSVVVIGFYAFYVESRNYGGVTSGPRWLMWLTPLWLLTMLPVADRLGARRWGRLLAYTFLAVSVMSVSYPAWNPWRHPWLYNFMEAHGWIHY